MLFLGGTLRIDISGKLLAIAMLALNLIASSVAAQNIGSEPVVIPESIEELDALITKVKAALKNDPHNPYLHDDLGRLYETQMAVESQAGNQLKSEKLFNLAIYHFENALSYNHNEVYRITYSIGRLYFNKMEIIRNQIDNDFSSGGLARQAQRQKQILQLADLALPYFQQCEKWNANDIEVIDALMQIYAIKDDLAKTQEYKSKLERIREDRDT